MSLVRRRLAWAVATLFALASSAAATRADAAGVWLTGGTARPLERRVAIAVGPDRVAWWTSVRFKGDGKVAGLLVPVPDGALLDFSSDAWLTALEASSALRIAPPGGLSPYCPGDSGPPSPVEIAGAQKAIPAVSPAGIALVDDAAGAKAWAESTGLTWTSDATFAFAGVPFAKILCVSFDATAGEHVSPTVRFVAPGAPPILPLSLVFGASTDDVPIAAWVFGPSHAKLDGTKAAVDPADVLWRAAGGTSSYGDARHDALHAVVTTPLDAFIEEMSLHDVLAAEVALPSSSVPGLAPTYFKGAADDGSGDPEHATCASATKAAIDATKAVGLACPRADLGAIGGATCTEPTPDGSSVDPSVFRCGPGADDLAVALSGMTPKDVRLTRFALTAPAKNVAEDQAVSFDAAATKLPYLQASSIDLVGCFDEVGGGGGAGASSGSAGTGAGTSGTGAGGPGNTSGSGASTSGPGGPGYDDPGVYVDVGGCDCSGTTDTVETYSSGSDDCEGDTGDATSSDDCGGDTAGSSGDDCSDDTSGSSEDCSGDSASGDDCAGDSAGSSDSCSGDSAGDSCSGDSAGDSCSSSSSSGDCTVSRGAEDQAGKRKPKAKLSALTLVLVALAGPLRRKRRRTK